MDSRNIILEVLCGLYKDLTQILYGTGQKRQTLDELIEVIVEAVLRFARTLIERYVGEVNEELFENRALLRPGLLV